MIAWIVFSEYQENENMNLKKFTGSPENIETNSIRGIRILGIHIELLYLCLPEVD